MKDIAGQKRRAAVARRSFDPSAERPPDVATKVFAEIGADLSRDGYIARAKGRRLFKRDGDTIYEVSFQSDRNNVAGERVAVWTHTSVGSFKLRQWRRQNGMPWGGLPHTGFAGGQIGNLTEPKSWMEWDFADAERRAATTIDLIAAIREIAFPFFARFENAAAALEALVTDEGLAPTWAIEFGQAHFGREGAERVGRAILARQPTMRGPFRAAVDGYRRKGLPPFHPAGAAESLAAIAVFLQLDLIGD
jgi:hypothetical protein